MSWVLIGTPEEQRGSCSIFPREKFKIKAARIALVAFCALQ